MKQILQNLKNGETSIMNVPIPNLRDGHLLIKSRCSLISTGTERMLVEFGRSGFLSKARQQPEKVKQVMQKIKTDGLISTASAVHAKLDQEIPLGYSNAGIVVDVGEGVEGFAAGDRVVSNGSHAEIVLVPKNLCARIPEQVSDEEAAFTVLGSIALQGVRLIQPTLGESIAVIGLGLVGLLTVQILNANGCKVLGVDKDLERLKLAKQFGVSTVDISRHEDPISTAMSLTAGRGMDGVIITAATKSSDPVQQAAKMSRKRGRIVLVGVAGLELNRAEFYEKELTFQVSCSYGPGRYDPDYEEKGYDYPLGYVRWTLQRNFEAVLDLMASGKLDIKPMITHRYPFDEALDAYKMFYKENEHFLGVVLQYRDDPTLLDKNSVELKEKDLTTTNIKAEEGSNISGEVVIGMIGAGEFTKRVLLPILKKSRVQLNTITTSGGLSAAQLGKKFEFQTVTGNSSEIFDDKAINTVFITTRHNSHGNYVLEALRTGKNVFVEKPLCLNLDDLADIKAVYQQAAKKHKDQGKRVPLLMVGFNRRFSPFIQKIKELTEFVSDPKCMIMTVNAGYIPEDHWIQDPEVGGGRIIGEACHFIDLLCFLAGSKVTDYCALALDDRLVRSGLKDSVMINLSFADGSIGSINYLSNGHKSYPKEKLELFSGEQVLILDNFRKLTGYGWPQFKKMQSFKQQKGHFEEISAFVNAVRGGKPTPIPFEQIEEVTRLSILIDSTVKNYSCSQKFYKNE